MDESEVGKANEVWPGKVRFAQERITDHFLGEIIPLLEKHYHEIAHYKDIPLRPDWNFYRGADACGGLQIFTVRDGSTLVGYGIFFVKESPHYSTARCANSDIIYLDPKLRGHLIGYRFIKWCDDRLREAGVQVVYHHIKAAHNWGRMIERQGYELQDLIYSKRLDL